MGDFINFLGNNLADFWTYTGFANATGGHVVMTESPLRANAADSYRIRYSDR